MTSNDNRAGKSPPAVSSCLEGVTREELPNGVTLLLRPSRWSPAAALVAWFRVGYFDEADDESGVAHLMEHMFFKGTVSHPDPEAIGHCIEGLGGSLNAGTIYDRTSYYFVVPARALTPAIRLMAEAISEPLLDPTELKREIEVVLEESRRKQDNPAALSSELLLEHAFDAHPIRRWRIGQEDVLRALTPERVRAFHQRLYAPENLVVSVVGDFKLGEILRVCTDVFGALTGMAQPRRARAPEPTQTALKTGRSWGTQPLEHFQLAFKIPGPWLAPQDLAGLGVLACILGQGRTSRLYQALKTELGLVRSISAAAWGYEQIGLFQVSAVFDPQGRPAVRQRILLELERLKHRGPTPGELRAALTQLEVGRLSQLEEVRGQASLLAWQECNGGLAQAAALQEHMRHLTSTDLQALACRYLCPESATLFSLVPRDPDRAEPADAPLTSTREDGAPANPPQGAELLEEWRSACSHAVLPSESPPMLKLPRARRMAPARRRGTLQEAHHAPDGPIVVHELAGLPLVALSLMFPGGTASDPAALTGRTRLALRAALAGGVGKHAPEAFFAVQAALGVRIDRLLSEEHVGLRLYGPSRQLGSALQLLESLLLSPQFQPERVERERETLLLELKQVVENPPRHAAQLMAEARYGPTHPNGLTLEHRSEVLRALTRAQLQDHFHALCCGERAQCVAVGDVRLEELQVRLTQLLQQLPGQWLQEPFPAAPRLCGVQERVGLRQRHQTALCFGFEAPPADSPCYPTLQVLLTCLSSFSGRLQTTLRGQEALAYSVGAHELGSRLDNLVICSLACEPKKEALARAGILREVRRLADAGICLDELTRAKSLLLGRLELGAQTLSGRVARIARQLQLGRPVEGLSQQKEQLQAVSLEAVQALAQTLFGAESYCLGVARAEKR